MGQVIRIRSSWVDYFLLTFVMLWSGGSFTYGLFAGWPYVMFVFALIMMLTRKQRLENYHYIAMGILSLVILLQTVTFGGSINEMYKPIMTLLAVMTIAVVIRPDFSNVFIKIVTFFAIISLCFWVIDLSPTGHNYLLNIAKSLPQLGSDILSEGENSWAKRSGYTLYFYNIYGMQYTADSFYYFLVRNPGPFYEPGRFTVMLSIALMLILYNGQYKRYKRPFYIILVADISTFSTTGYFVLLLIFAFYLLGRRRKVNLSYIILTIVFFVAVRYALDLSFLSEKVLVQLDEVKDANTRFGAMLYHWTQIQQSPFIGYGVFLNQTFSILEMSPNGITDMMRRWGIPVFFLCVWLAFYSTRLYLVNNKVFRIAFVTALLLLAYSQTIMSSPLYYLLYFIGSNQYFYGKKTEI